MAESIQEQIVKKVATAMAGIKSTDGYGNTVASVQRHNQSGVVLEAVPVILLQEGECVLDTVNSPYPWTQRRLELYVIAITRQDETAQSPDTRSGGELLNSLMADCERALLADQTWGGLAIRTEPPAYLEVELETNMPHLGKALRTEIIYRHLRHDPYSNAA